MIVIGREDFDEAALEDHVQLSDQGIVFLPQEGFLDLVLFGYNWWLEEIDELNSVLEYMKAFNFFIRYKTKPSLGLVPARTNPMELV